MTSHQSRSTRSSSSSSSSSSAGPSSRSNSNSSECSEHSTSTFDDTHGSYTTVSEHCTKKRKSTEFESTERSTGRVSNESSSSSRSSNSTATRPLTKHIVNDLLSSYSCNWSSDDDILDCTSVLDRVNMTFLINLMSPSDGSNIAVHFDDMKGELAKIRDDIDTTRVRRPISERIVWKLRLQFELNTPKPLIGEAFTRKFEQHLDSFASVFKVSRIDHQQTQVESLTSDMTDAWMESHAAGPKRRTEFLTLLGRVEHLFDTLFRPLLTESIGVLFTNRLGLFKTLMYLATHVVFVQTNYSTLTPAKLIAYESMSTFLIAGIDAIDACKSYLAVDGWQSDLIAECIAVLWECRDHQLRCGMLWFQYIAIEHRYPPVGAQSGKWRQDYNHFIMALMHVRHCINRKKPQEFIVQSSTSTSSSSSSTSSHMTSSTRAKERQKDNVLEFFSKPTSIELLKNFRYQHDEFKKSASNHLEHIKLKPSTLYRGLIGVILENSFSGELSVEKENSTRDDRAQRRAIRCLA